MTMMEIFAKSDCELAEGPLWHPQRESLIWFDILGKKLFEKKPGEEHKVWQFDEHVSAAGWISKDQILVASEAALFTFDLETSDGEAICDLEADNPATRSNDGRADPFGGFWIGTMGKSAEAEMGSIYRYYKGELRKLFDKITISNSICFSPDKSFACYTDTVTRIIKKVKLDADGWPIDGSVEDFIDFNGEELNPDGSVIDKAGNIWVAQWGASRVACYDAEGNFVREVTAKTPHVSCPAFGGADYKTLFATTAQEHLDEDVIKATEAGSIFFAEIDAEGQPEPQVIL